MDYYDYRPLENQYRWWNPLENTILTSTLLAVVIGAYALVKGLDILGYPVWLWIHQFASMLIGVLRLRGARQEEGESSEYTMQHGGVLSSVFGWSSGSLLQKGVRGLTSALSSRPSNVPPGLGNISNSCYQNSVIQGLSALPSLRNHLSKVTTEHSSLTADSTNGALFDMISKLNDPGNQGQHFWIRGKLKSMSTFQQQDAQEYYSKVLDALDNEVKKAAGSKRRSSVSWAEATKSLSELPKSENDNEKDETTQANAVAEQANLEPNPLDGLIAQRVGCTVCGYSEGLSLISFNCITVSLGNNYAYDIRECLDEYTKLEYIDGVECAKCTLLKLQKTLAPLAAAQPGSPFDLKLKAVSEMVDDEKFDDNALVKTLNIPKKNWVQSSKSKQIVIARAPKALVLHINRSIFDETTGAQYKNTAGVSYPTILDLGNWCIGSSPSGSRQPDISLEEWPRDPQQSMLPDLEDEPMTTSPFQYRLRAAVTHFGSHGNGHYVCYRPRPRPQTQEDSEDNEDTQEERSESDEQWWRFSDDTVYAVPEEQAHQGNVFMLFYERLDEDDHVDKTPQEIGAHTNTFAVTQDAPLPPAHVVFDGQFMEDAEAAEVPLPDDDDLVDLIPPETPAAQPAAPPTLVQTEDDMSDATTENTSPENNTISDSPTADLALTHSAYPSPPPPPSLTATPHDHEQYTDTEMSEAESEDAPSTSFTSDAEDIPAPPTPKIFTPIPPHLMRTAGDAAARGQGSRQSLPLVSAT
jgi:ubiquitin carboxyl-terminal hydrolase 1